jgi:hypothetical protein
MCCLLMMCSLCCMTVAGSVIVTAFALHACKVARIMSLCLHYSEQCPIFTLAHFLRCSISRTTERLQAPEPATAANTKSTDTAHSTVDKSSAAAAAVSADSTTKATTAAAPAAAISAPTAAVTTAALKSASVDSAAVATGPTEDKTAAAAGNRTVFIPRTVYSPLRHESLRKQAGVLATATATAAALLYCSVSRSWDAA